MAAVQEPGAALRATSDLLDRFTAVFQAVAGFAAAGVADRVQRRQHQRRRAGSGARHHGRLRVRVRTLLRMAVVEGGVIGVLGALLGLGLGVLALGWWMAAVAGDIPELQLLVVLTPAAIATTLLFGVVVVGMAPLFTVCKLRRMDVPSALRVME